jgi:hypothetical protein
VGSRIFLNVGIREISYRPTKKQTPTIYSAAFTLIIDLPPLSISGYNSKYEGM